MNKRKTIFVFVDWFVPGTNAGGPIRSVYSLVKLLSHEFNFKIFTRNTDHNSSTPYPGIVPNEWIRFSEGIDVYYCSHDNLDKILIEKMLTTTLYDKVYINSFYSKWFSIVPLQVLKKLGLQHRVVLAPRGMLGKGALQIKSLKKKAFITYAKLAGLHKGITWQASSENEKKDIQKVFGTKTQVKVAGNLSYIDQLPYTPKNKKPGELRLFFLSRLVPIKNLHTAIESLAGINNMELTYDVYGPVEDELYYQKCLDLAKNLPNISVNFKGVLHNEAIQQTLQNYHALLMPTLNENFGHSILESFCAGCPVIISDQTPWNGLEEKGVGYNVQVFGSQSVAQLQQAIKALGNMDGKTFNVMSQNTYEYGRQYQQNSQNLSTSVSVFL